MKSIKKSHSVFITGVILLLCTTFFTFTDDTLSMDTESNTKLVHTENKEDQKKDERIRQHEREMKKLRNNMMDQKKKIIPPEQLKELSKTEKEVENIVRSLKNSNEKSVQH